MKAFCYILFSKKLDRFYIGFTNISVQERLERHLSKYYENKYTSKADDWEIFLTIECDSEKQARNIEKHIKKMKSRKYIQNLKAYPEIVDKLKNRYE